MLQIFTGQMLIIDHKLNEDIIKIMIIQLKARYICEMQNNFYFNKSFAYFIISILPHINCKISYIQ